VKAAPFDYKSPQDLVEALRILKSNEESRVLAGGQTLVPMMAYRMVRPSILVDINQIKELDYRGPRDGYLAIGALTRHRNFQSAATNGVLGDLLATVVQHIAHIPIRTRGTFCGSIAHADPASEWCLTTVTLDGSVVLAGAEDSRVLPASEFFEGFLSTAIEPGEIISEVRLPRLSDDARFGFYEFSRRAGDYALAMSLAVVRVDGERIIDARVGIGGVEGAPRRIPEVEEQLADKKPSLELIKSCAKMAAQSVAPLEDSQADATLRRELTEAVVDRALKKALRL
jgi:aerobic carbon-monoxide dehydrogenase medium subunit